MLCPGTFYIVANAREIVGRRAAHPCLPADGDTSVLTRKHGPLCTRRHRLPVAADPQVESHKSIQKLVEMVDMSILHSIRKVVFLEVTNSKVVSCKCPTGKSYFKLVRGFDD